MKRAISWARYRPASENPSDRSRMESPDLKKQQLDAWLALTGRDSPLQETVRLPMLSGSMLPTIPPGAILEIKPAGNPDCRIGDVVVFQESSQHLTAHRVLACLNLGPLHWLLQKGDNNALGHWISFSRVRGIVSRVLPGDEDGAGKNPIDPYSPYAARSSRRQHFRNLALKWPRRFRDLLFPTSRTMP